MIKLLSYIVSIVRVSMSMIKFTMKKELISMDNKTHMDLKTNAFYAKKLVVQSIYVGAKLANCNVTFSETQTIVDGENVASVSLKDIETVLNLKRAWRFMLDTIDKPITLEYICQLHSFVAYYQALAWGTLRTGDVRISGTSYVPKIPQEKEVLKKIRKIKAIENGTQRAIEYFIYACKQKLFWDGNHRMSMMIANKYLIMDGAGLFSPNEKDFDVFNACLSAYYDDERNKPILREYLYNYVITDPSCAREAMSYREKKKYINEIAKNKSIGKR